MMTLRKLQQSVGIAKIPVGKTVPTPKAVREGGTNVAARVVLGDGSVLKVYDSGYVVYLRGKRATVFPLHDISGDYVYETAERYDRPDMLIPEEMLMSLPWYFAVLLRAEDRIVRSENNSKAHYIQLPEGMIEDIAEGIADPEMSPLDLIILKETLLEAIRIVNEALRYVTEAQYEVILDYFFEEMDQEYIANKLNISQQGVSDRYRRALDRMRKGLGLHKNEDGTYRPSEEK